MGKKTEEKVRAFNIAYKTCHDLTEQYDDQRKRYAPLLVELKYGSKNHNDREPIPDHLKKVIRNLDVITKNYIAPLSAQSSNQLKKTESALIDLQKWVDQKSKADPTTWRKVKDSIKIKA